MCEDENLVNIFSKFRGEKNELIPILQAVQDEFGYLPKDTIKKIAKFVRVSESKVYGVASFYTHFRLTPTGKNKISVCRGTACHVRGSPQILEEIKRRLCIKEGESTSDLEYSLETVACLGCCALAPVITINEEVYGRMTLKEVANILPDRRSR